MNISKKEYNKLTEKQQYIYDRLKLSHDALLNVIDECVINSGGFYQNEEVNRSLYQYDDYLEDLLTELIKLTNEKNKG